MQLKQRIPHQTSAMGQYLHIKDDNCESCGAHPCTPLGVVLLQALLGPHHNSAYAQYVSGTGHIARHIHHHDGVCGLEGINRLIMSRKPKARKHALRTSLAKTTAYSQTLWPVHVLGPGNNKLFSGLGSVTTSFHPSAGCSRAGLLRHALGGMCIFSLSCLTVHKKELPNLHPLGESWPRSEVAHGEQQSGGTTTEHGKSSLQRSEQENQGHLISLIWLDTCSDSFPLILPCSFAARRSVGAPRLS